VIREMLNIKNVFTLYGMISFSPLIISLWIAVSRCLDNKHHEDDVFVGAIIGCTVTLIAYESVKIIIKKVNIDPTSNYNSNYHRMESDDYDKIEIVVHHI
jgi:membrane-associated phospholipid phosphatase